MSTESCSNAHEHATSLTLHRLPGEVRNMVYGYLLDEAIPTFPNSLYPVHAMLPQSSKNLLPWTNFHMRHPFLFQQVDLQEEYLALAYKHVTFVHKVKKHHTLLGKLPNSTPELVRAHVRSVKIDVNIAQNAFDDLQKELGEFLKGFPQMEEAVVRYHRLPSQNRAAVSVEDVAHEVKGLEKLVSLRVLTRASEKKWIKNDQGDWDEVRGV